MALSSGAADVLENARVYATLEEALAPVTLAFALTARVRDLGPPPCDIRQAADLACAHLGQAAEGVAAIVLGTEVRAHQRPDRAVPPHLPHPANPQYSSLNVAQALQLAAWELRYALLIDQGAALLPVSTAQEPSRGAGNRPPAKRCRPSWLIGNRRWSRYVSWTPSTPEADAAHAYLSRPASRATRST